MLVPAGSGQSHVPECKGEFGHCSDHAVVKNACRCLAGSRIERDHGLAASRLPGPGAEPDPPERLPLVVQDLNVILDRIGRPIRSQGRRWVRGGLPVGAIVVDRQPE